MTSRNICPAILLMGLAVVVAQAQAGRDQKADRFWPQWRGPNATGVSRTANPPLEWSETKNIKWKTEIPGRGAASPVVWGDRLYLLTAVPIGLTGDAAHAPRGTIEPRHVYRFVVLAVDGRDGDASSGKRSRAKNARTKPPTRQAPSPRVRLSPTASVFLRSSSPGGCTHMT
jgi:hypothetical protein